MLARGWLLAALACLPACAPRQRTRRVTLGEQVMLPEREPFIEQPKAEPIPTSADTSIDIYEARWDVPLPFDARRNRANTRQSVDGTSCVFVFQTSLSEAACGDFYHSEMERLGWQEAAVFSFTPHELLLMYEKPAQRAVVYIVPEGNSCLTVRLYVGIKNQGHAEHALGEQHY